MIPIKPISSIKADLQSYYNSIEEEALESNSSIWLEFLFWCDLNNLIPIDVICGDVNKLNEIRNLVGISCGEFNFYNYFLELYDKFADSKSSIGNVNKFKVTDLQRITDLKSCPYCNRSFVSLYRKGKKTLRTGWLDHFYPKDKYPYLALSFFNLIPTCPTCNQKKGTSEFSFNPYSNEYDVDFDIKFEYLLLPDTPLDKIDSIDLKLIAEDEQYKNFISKLELEEIYKTHIDYVFNLINREKILNNTNRNDLYNRVGELFNNRKQFELVLQGNYYEKDDLHKGILTKLNRDIFNQIRMSKKDID